MLSVVAFLLIYYLINPAQVLASRAFAPVKITPIIYKDIKIVAENNSPENMGIIQAFDINTNKLIWSKQVYKVRVKPNVEADTQWVFIKDMEIDGDRLVVINEKQKTYTLDPNTGNSLDKSSTASIIIIIPIILIILMYIVFRMKRLP
ncbi:hypothetical protein DESME_13310 [Desulfitobacterium metallireducens DSM 15288]|uniref:Uncharacterized protein n=1 Tax=Desulfitobacterium metallireducens DSM 15288 TaxID=871968 RepID=W0EHK2_9FIRM|nr:hypothetical protein DESME_13310 [Desulfitobacterium metallireducens DSM 15288]